MDNVIFKKSVISDPAARLEVIDEIIAALKQSGCELVLDDYEFYLILDEAITNSMEHGNRWGKEKKVHIRCTVNPNSFSITIKDEGIGFNPEFVINNYPLTGKNLSPRGRGIFIIRKYCTVEWNSVGNEISISMEVKN